VNNKFTQKPHGVFQMTTITAKNTKAEILAEALPLIDDQADKIQALTERLNFALITLGITAATAALF
jgi:hypothetical protein